VSLRRLLVLVSLAPLAGGAALLAGQAWLAAKAEIAEALIERAFDAHLADGAIHRPWSWADTHPVARLEVPRLGVERFVLAGGSGSSMAFGPGHLDGTAAPNGEGNSVLTGHRDSWFAFLERLRVGDELRMQTRETMRCYHVGALEVRAEWETEVLAPAAGRRLTLITCYPFGGLRGGDLRYVVTSREGACGGPRP
jgi:sortase A